MIDGKGYDIKIGPHELWTLRYSFETTIIMSNHFL